MAGDNRYQLERTQGGGDPAIGQLEGNVQRVLEQLSTDADDGVAGTATAAGAPGTSYTPAVAGDWTTATPTTVQEALDLIAANLGPV